MNKKAKPISRILGISLALTCGASPLLHSPVYAEETELPPEASGYMKPAGWVEEPDGRYWYRNTDGSYTKGAWKKIDGCYYYFDNAGYMKTGWLKKDGNWYLLDKEKGFMKTGWAYDGQDVYKDPNYGLHTFYDSGCYYFDSDGVMQTGWNHSNGKTYYIDQSGKRKAGWLTQNGKSYYFLEHSYNSDEQNRLIVNEWVGFDYVNENGEYVPGKVHPKKQQIEAELLKKYKEYNSTWYPDAVRSDNSRYEGWTGDYPFGVWVMSGMPSSQKVIEPVCEKYGIRCSDAFVNYVYDHIFRENRVYKYVKGYQELLGDPKNPNDSKEKVYAVAQRFWEPELAQAAYQIWLNGK